MEKEKLKFKAYRYAIGVFVIIIFLWWLAGGHIISFLAPKPSPAEVIVKATASAFKIGLATIFNSFLNLFK
ncbi:MAG: hypothetical protein ACP5JU_01715 [Minisyncoccia bacterium]